MPPNDRLYQQLRRGNTAAQPPPQEQFSFQGSSSSPFRPPRAAPAAPTPAPVQAPVRTTTQTLRQPTVRTNVAPAPPPAATPPRQADGDRPSAYAPVAAQKPGEVRKWKRPSFWDIMKDLGLRMVEAGVQAIAAEVAYFFTRRRFGSKYHQGTS